MSVQKYPGRVLSKTPPTITPPVDGEGGSAPGVWTLSEALENEKAGTWPKPLFAAELYMFGEGLDGQIGNDAAVSVSSPVQVGATSDWRRVTTGSTTTLALKSNGTLWGWGGNNFGALGLNQATSEKYSSPVQVGALTTWDAVEMESNVFAITTNNELYAWGRGQFGALGNNDTASLSSPVQIGALTNWSRVTPGVLHCVSVKTDGTLWTWGLNSNGELGHNNTTYLSSPVQVGSLTTWTKSMSAGNTFTHAINSSGELYGWGRNNLGQVGNNSVDNVSSPVQIGALADWSSLAAGENFVLAVKTDGTLWGWGINNRGQLAQNNVVSFSSPVQVGALTNWSQITCTDESALAVKTDGTLWALGKGLEGQTGQNDAADRSSPVQVGVETSWVKVFKATGDTVAALAK